MRWIIALLKGKPLGQAGEVSGKGQGALEDLAVKAAIFVAGAVAGIAVWSQIRPQEPLAARVASLEPRQSPVVATPPGPADAARDIYVAQPAPMADPLPVDAPAGETLEVSAIATADSVLVAPMVGEEIPPLPAPGSAAAPDSREGEGVFEMLDTPLPPVSTKYTPGEVVMVQPPAPGPETPSESALPAPLGPLEEKYLAALERSATGVARTDKAYWDEEIQRVLSGQSLSAAAMAGLPEPLAKLQDIYRREKERGNAPEAFPDARQLEIFVYCHEELKFYLNGQPQPWVSSNAGVNKASLKLKFGDVLGFELPSNRELAVLAKFGMRTMFSSRETWEAVENPGAEFWTGGKAENRTRVTRQKSGFKSRTSYFEQVTKVQSSRYSVIWGSGRQNIGVRYIIRKVDLPEQE